jgi:hypothetical protein
MLLTALILDHSGKAGPLEAGVRYLSILPNDEKNHDPK